MDSLAESAAALTAVLSTMDLQVQALQAVVLCRSSTALHKAQAAKGLEYATSLRFTVSALPNVPR